MKPLVKICGMRDRQNLAAVAALEPDLLGLIFYKHSPRFVGSDFQLSDALPSAKRVGVFVNETVETIEALRTKHQLRWIQLHGQESLAMVQEGYRLGWSMIKAFSIDEEFDFASTLEFAPFCKYFLFDTKGAYPGGNGRAFDWALLKNYTGNVPFLLSGGLAVSALNALKMVHHHMLAGFDFNSGVELAPGIKSIELVGTVINELKNRS